MSAVSASALKLAGFLMAHAFWIISDLDQGDAYVPQALCEGSAGRELFVFEADTQAEAVAKGKSFMAENAASYDRCAFARDGHVQTKEGYIDVLSIDVVERKARGLTIIQAYLKAETTGLALLGDEELLAREGDPAPPSDAVASLRAGAAEHEHARLVWEKLNTNRAAAVKLF